MRLPEEALNNRGQISDTYMSTQFIYEKEKVLIYRPDLNEYLWDLEKMFKTGVVRANEC